MDAEVNGRNGGGYPRVVIIGRLVAVDSVAVAGLSEREVLGSLLVGCERAAAARQLAPAGGHIWSHFTV